VAGLQHQHHRHARTRWLHHRGDVRFLFLMSQQGDQRRVVFFNSALAKYIHT
jgi:hypothetical protein